MFHRAASFKQFRLGSEKICMNIQMNNAAVISEVIEAFQAVTVIIFDRLHDQKILPRDEVARSLKEAAEKFQEQKPLVAEIFLDLADFLSSAPGPNRPRLSVVKTEETE